MEPEWLTKARSEGRIKETLVSTARLTSDAASAGVTLPHEQLTEKQFQARVVGLAVANGWSVYHTHDSRRSQAGYPDLTLWRGKRLVFAELKKDHKSKPSAAQSATLAALANTGNEVYLWRPADWAQIVTVLIAQEALHDCDCGQRH